MSPTAFWGLHTRKIILQCLLVATPMVASSLVVMGIVYAHLVNEGCPSEELCPGPDTMNATLKGHYYVDFPAARLAFVSSGSSTVSLALVGYLMTMYAYTSAASLQQISDKANYDSLPSPYQLSVLLRVLNAELMVLLELAFSKVKGVFWRRKKHGEISIRPPPILGRGVIVLLAGVFASLLVQFADVYFHIAAEAVEMIQVQAAPAASHSFSRGLASWCLDRPTVGGMGQKNYFGCAITAQPAAYNNATSLAATNASIISDMKNSISDLHKTITFEDSNRVQYAIVGPADVDTSMDWKASSFGVSTTCSAIPENGCNVSVPITNAKSGQGSPIMLVPFNCTVEGAGIAIVGNLTTHNTAVHTMNFHKYAAESPPFLSNTLVDLEDFQSVLRNINAGEDANDILKNQWNTLVLRKIPSAVQGDFSQLPPSFPNDTRVWKHNLIGAFVLLHCNVTVWDMTYMSIGSKITIVNKAPSNGSTAGISSMPGTRFIGTLANVFQDESTGPLSRSSPDNFIRSFEMGMSKAYSYPLASQMSGRPSLRAQVRTSRVVTRLPSAALWFLVAANMAYAVLGFDLAIWAIVKTTEQAGQVQIRLGVSGLIAALFDRKQFERVASSDAALFEEKSFKSANGVKRIGVMGTKEGGATFSLYQPGGAFARRQDSDMSRMDTDDGASKGKY